MKSYVLLLAVVLFTSSCTGVVYLADRNKNQIMDNILSGKKRAVEKELKEIEKKDKNGTSLFFEGMYLTHKKSYEKANSVLSEFIDQYPENRYIRDAKLLRNVIKDIEELKKENEQLQGASIHFETTLGKVSAKAEECMVERKSFREICTQLNDSQDRINSLTIVQKLKTICSDQEMKNLE